MVRYYVHCSLSVSLSYYVRYIVSYYAAPILPAPFLPLRNRQSPRLRTLSPSAFPLHNSTHTAMYLARTLLMPPVSATPAGLTHIANLLRAHRARSSLAFSRSCPPFRRFPFLSRSTVFFLFLFFPPVLFVFSPDIRSFDCHHDIELSFVLSAGRLSFCLVLALTTLESATRAKTSNLPAIVSLGFHPDNTLLF